MIGGRRGMRPEVAVRRSWLFGALGLALAVAGCAGTVPTPSPSPVGPVAPPETQAPPPLTPQAPAVRGDSPAVLPGWDQEDHFAAFNAYLAGCSAARDAAGRAVCARGRALAAAGPVSPSEARRFFETQFIVVEARTADGNPGRLTAYFAPEYAARRVADAVFDTPVLAAPADLSRTPQGVVQVRPDGTTGPYPDRAAIEAGPPPSAILGWMKAEDLFFMQIQGSGYLTFEDGGRTRAAYAADNGRPFRGIATPMAQQGLLPADGTSGEAIRGWLADHRGAEARAVTALNPRYIFFRADPDDGGHPAGAAGIALPARRAIAVDPASWTYGDLVWIQAEGGNLIGARASYHGLVMALDTGSAIRGPVRADLYLGRGQAAGLEAGAVRHPLRMWRLVPRG